MKYIKLLEDVSNAYGAPGYEDQVIDVVKANKGDFSLQADAMKNLYMNFTDMDPNKPTIMLDSHMDEVGFMVQAIDENGLLLMQALGGWTAASAQSQLFMVRTNDNESYVPAVATSKPIHFMTAEEKAKPVALTDLKLDVGATSREEVINDFGITVGQPVVPATKFQVNEKNGMMIGKAFDNRLGVAATIAVFNELGLEGVKNLPFNLVGAFATQEEVGLRGAKVTTNRIDPQVAIVFEGTPSDDYAKSATLGQGRVKQGPQLRYRDSTYIASDHLNGLFLKASEDAGITIQQAVRDGGGTNAGSIHTANNGVSVITLGMPTRYAHTHYLISAYQDFQDTVDVTVAFLKGLTAEDLAFTSLQDL
ncbi:MAG: M20/M25/M40 family metallo-hydrolase [Aerococcus urinaeequi]